MECQQLPFGTVIIKPYRIGLVFHHAPLLRIHTIDYQTFPDIARKSIDRFHIRRHEIDTFLRNPVVFSGQQDSVSIHGPVAYGTAYGQILAILPCFIGICISRIRLSVRQRYGELGYGHIAAE